MGEADWRCLPLGSQTRRLTSDTLDSRLRPEHDDPARVPPGVARFGSPFPSDPGQAGLVELDFKIRGAGETARGACVRQVLTGKPAPRIRKT